MPHPPRAVEYANPATCWKYQRDRPDLKPLGIVFTRADGTEEPFPPDGVILIVGADMSVTVDVPGEPLPLRIVIDAEHPEGWAYILETGARETLALTQEPPE